MNELIDELPLLWWINQRKEPKKEVEMAASSASLDALLNLPSKSIKPIKATESPAILLILKPITTEPKESPITQPFLIASTQSSLNFTRKSTSNCYLQSRFKWYDRFNKYPSFHNIKLNPLLLNSKPSTMVVLVVTNKKSSSFHNSIVQGQN